jgi:hypothetical protein
MKYVPAGISGMFRFRRYPDADPFVDPFADPDGFACADLTNGVKKCPSMPSLRTVGGLKTVAKGLHKKVAEKIKNRLTKKWPPT